ncbi:FimV/HubP family polar landmark protein [Amphritea balenae]|uniref:FimV N-terminal domain-containing protein n=1 Tax=Amphritea balenae TaxID=452629 RepID=A0A3P1SKS0_9GAMM|nr:FimV/HubP family polar landmark protein [Amphritea balenae]RRC97748.1 hypothetical protein EHS89_16355 [Amphritea balenae]GGK82716.1 hypothetical protein GCM10007941_36480 [Amphritea balenae]
MLRKLALSLAIAGALGTSNANALGLGEIKITSALNEPLQAEIQLLQMRDVDPQQIQPRMANIDEFALAGIEKLRFLSDVQFQVKPGPGGRGIITMSSAVPVNEPFLNFLVEVNWPSGRLVREYTVLLDPPVYDPTPAPKAIQPASAGAVIAPAPVTSTAMADAKPVDNIRTRMTGSQIYVDVNDTLWNIAKRHKPAASVSEAQMMLALQRKNPTAFAQNNVNRLKAGVVLDLPTLEEAKALSQKQANEEFWRQTNLWKQGGSAVAAEAEQMDASAADKKDAASVKKDDEVAVKSADGQLKIVSPAKQDKDTDTGKVSDQAADTDVSQSDSALLERNKELETELATALESVDQIQRENEELTGRVDALAQQMESLQRLLELKDQQLAELQAELDQAKSQPVVAPVAPAPQPKGLMDEFGMYIYGAGAAVVALLAGLLVMMRRRKKDEPEAGEEPAPVAIADEIDDAVTEEVVEEAAEEVADDAVEEVVDAVAEEEDISDADLDDLDLDMDLDELESPDSTIEDDEFDLGLDDAFGDEDSVAEESLDITDEQPEVELPQEEEVDDALDSILGEDTESMDLDDLSIDDVDSSLADLADDEVESLEDLLAGTEDDSADDDELEFDVQSLEAESDAAVEEELELDNIDDALADDDLELDFNLDEPEAEDDSSDGLAIAAAATATAAAAATAATAFETDSADASDIAEDDQALGDMLAEDDSDLEDLESLLGGNAEENDELDDDSDEFADLEDLINDSGSDDDDFETGDSDLDELLAGVADSDIEEIAGSELEVELAAEVEEAAVADSSELHPELEELLESAVADDVVLEEQDLSADVDDLEASINHDLDAELDSELEELLGGAGNDDLSLESIDDSDDEAFDSLNLLEGADEVETKLDLARAYIDMEDVDGAKDILDEILKEGSDAQQQEANTLLETINS